MDILENKERTANKEHKCDFCGGSIIKGDRYQYQKIARDGELYEWKCHIHCSWLASHYDMYDYCEDGLDPDSFREQLLNIFNDEITIPKMASILYKKETNTEVDCVTEEEGSDG